MTNPRATDDPAATYAWTAHPAGQRPLAALAAVLIIALISSATTAFEGGLAWPLLSALILCLSLNRFFFTSYYELDADGITVRAPFGRRRLRWSEIDRAEFGRYAAWLAPARGGRNARRGILVLLGREREEVVSRIRARLGARAAPAAQIPRETLAPPAVAEDRTRP